MQIQEYLIAAVQNLQVLFKYGAQPTRGIVLKVDRMKQTLTQAIGPALHGLKELLIPNLNRIAILRFVSFEYIKSGNLKFQIL